MTCGAPFTTENGNQVSISVYETTVHIAFLSTNIKTQLSPMLEKMLSVRGGQALGGASDSIKLVYFDAKGAAELTRILMKIGCLEFEDFRYPVRN